MFRFANPQYLWLLLAVPALVALYWLAARNRRRRLARFGRPGILEELMPEVSTGRTAFRFILFCAAVALVILAAARPQFGSKLREEKAQGIEMMLTVDVSNSMLAEDFEPNRLERTKYAIGKLFEGLQQDRVGLVVFAGEPKVQLPITSDYRMARAFARRIDPSLVSVQGTAIGKALEQALLAFSGDTEQSHGRVIILITDGENHDDDAIAVASYPVDLHHPVGGDCSLYWCPDCYDIPYRCLIPQKIDGLIVAGRNVSMTHLALASARVMGPAMALGEAAGKAAALSVKENVQLRDLDVRKLQESLKAEGVYFRE